MSDFPHSASLRVVGVAFLCWLALVMFYLNTAVLQGEGGPGERLVFKPFHGLVPFYGGGEEDASRDHPDEPAPWWRTGDYVELFSTSYETTAAPWEAFYAAGYVLLLPAALGVLIGWIRARRQAEAELIAHWLP